MVGLLLFGDTNYTKDGSLHVSLTPSASLQCEWNYTQYTYGSNGASTSNHRINYWSLSSHLILLKKWLI